MTRGNTNGRTAGPSARVAAPPKAEPPSSDPRRQQPRHRRLEDNRRHGLVTALARHLAAQPSLPQVAEFVYALLTYPLGAAAVTLVGRDESDEPHVLGQFPAHPGAPLDRAQGRRAEDLLSAIRSAGARGGPVLWTADGDVEGDAPGPLAAWPMGCPEDPDAYLVVALEAPVPPGVLAERTEGLAEVLGVYLLRPDAPDSWQLGSRRSHLARDTSLPSGTRAVTTPGGIRLTPRQCRILHLMAAGLTNAQIAARIGFSASTVRVETLTIFRALGVHDRHRAVEAAQVLGLLRPGEAGTSEPICAAHTA